MIKGSITVKRAIYSEEYIAQMKIKRVFLLLNCIAKGDKRLHQISRDIGCSKRTSQRYLHLLESVGFQIIKTRLSHDVRYSLGTEYQPEFVKELACSFTK